MRSLIPFDGLFGDTVLDHFFDDDMPTVYKDYVAVPKVDIEDLKDHYEITCDMPGFTKDQIHISYENGVLSLSARKKTNKKPKMKIVTSSVANVASALSSVSSL